MRRLLLAALRAVSRRPRAALLLLALATLPLAAAAAGLKPDNSLSVWFVEDDPALLAYREFLREFGSDEAVAAAYPTPGGALSPGERALQLRAAERLRAIEGVEEVLSPATLAASLPPGEGTADALRRAGVVSEDGETALLLVRMSARPDLDAVRGEILEQIREALAETVGVGGRGVHLAGNGVLYDALNRQTIRDSALYLGLAFVLMTALLWLTLRRARAVAVALAGPLAASGATLGIFALSGRPLTQVTAILPMLILVIGLTDAIHLVSHHYTERRAHPPAGEPERRERVARSMADLAVPCLFTSVTTALGFLALSASRMPVVRDLGLFAAVGMVLVWVLTMVACTAGLALRDLPPPPESRGTDRALAALGRALPRRRGWVLAGSAAAAALLLAGVARMEVNTYTLELLPPGHEVREDSRWIEAHAGFYTPLEFVVRSTDGRPVLRPEVLDRLGEWRRRAERRPEVGRTFGAADLGERSVYLSRDGRTARITAYVPMSSTQGFAATARALEREGREVLGEGVTIRAAGYLPLYLRIIDYVLESTLRGLALAAGVVFVVLGLLLRSLPLTAAAVPVNLFPVLLVFGVMGWSGIPLDIATATIGAIVLGIAVDDSIHFLFRYRGERRAGAAPEAAVGTTLQTAGRGIVLSTVVLALGFAVLAASGSRSIAYFGILAALAVVGALVADLFLLPALLLGGSRRTAA
ncbi:MAG TPA: MMPL family transporter [Longimicrobiaceae bacterium]|nr:MMPL family transporter [Longimicrobiaceae bacterium]